MLGFWKKGEGAATTLAAPVAVPVGDAVALTASRLLGDLMRGLPKRGQNGKGPRVFVAGPPSGTTIETFHQLGCRVTVAGDDDFALPTEWPERTFDLVLGWDILDRMPGAEARALAGEWARIIRPSGGLYLLARQEAAVLPFRWRADVQPDGTLRLIPQAGERPTIAPRKNRELEELVRPLAVRDIFLRREGLREVLCRRQ